MMQTSSSKNWLSDAEVDKALLEYVLGENWNNRKTRRHHRILNQRIKTKYRTGTKPLWKSGRLF